MKMLFPGLPDSSVQTVVSFDQGGEWVPLRKPADSKCDATAKDPDKVNRGNWCIWRRINDRNLTSHKENCVPFKVKGYR